MQTITLIFNQLLYRPLFNALVLLYNWIPDFGIAIIILTVLIRLVLFPLNQRSIASQKKMTKLQPKLQQLQRKFKDNKEQLSQVLMAFYRKHQINPLGGCLPVLVQLPILLALFRVFIDGLRPEALTNLYSFVNNPGQINPYFLGLINLAEKSLLLALFAGIFQFIQTKMISPNIKKPVNGMAGAISKQMLYLMPIITVFIAWRFPAGLPLYWITTTLFGIGQQYYVFSKDNPKHSQRTN